MDFGRFRFFLHEVFTNLTRNATMQLTSIGTVAVSIVLLGTFLFVRESSAHLGSQVLGQIEISAYLDDSSTDDSAKAVRERILTDKRIRSIRYINKVDGLKQLRDRMNGQIDTSLLTSNPLPNAFHVRVDVPAHVPLVAARLEKVQGVAKVTYAKEVVTRLLTVAAVIQNVGLILVVSLSLVSAILISNTIRMTVDARRREIAIMQLVGATNSYIRAPFICEGLVDGVLGAGIAIALLYGAHVQFLPRIIGALPFLPLGHLAVDETEIVLEMLLTGALVGAGASWFAVNRYLKT